MKDIYGSSNARAVKKLEKIAQLVEDKQALYCNMTDEELSGQTQVLKQRFAGGETLDDLLPDAFAVMREASFRVLQMKHFHVQILGGICLHQGRICQMATGEGKTLTETLPAYLNAISGQGVHIITVNEYLACRDAEWMGKVFKFLGLTVGVTLSNTTPSQKRQAYACDITYGTNSEFGFDYLRDNMSVSRENCVQRGLNYVIIDEVDSILIDEARTPLIISGPSDKSSELYVTANKFVVTLQNSTNTDQEGHVLSDKTDILGRVRDDGEPNGDYVVDRKSKTARLTDKGIAKAERYFKLDNLSDPDNSEINHYINNALKAHAIMHRDDDYVVERGEILIVDSFTGRKLKGRRYSGGLHQAIEAKEHVTIQRENKTLATITIQNYFRLYHKLSGMTGTAKTEENEFNTIYNIDVVAIPTNLPMVRKDCNDLVYTTRNGKLNAIVKEIAKRHAIGQPILVGTITVEKSEELSALLKKQNIPHNVLNAKFHKREAEIIAQAGCFGAVTISTNMAGRGTDILLGGNPEFYAKQQMAKDGYTDEQIELATSFAKGNDETEKLKQIYADLYSKFKVQTDEEKKQVIEVGGLCVIGTERHDSRRIDDQLRGRAGRQGDVGMSQFFLSCEDDLVRIFGGDTIQRLLMFANFGEDEAIQMKLLSKAIESAQKRVEGMHFSSRKNVLQYDDVNNQQRKAIYKERDRILDGNDVHQEILDMTSDYARIVLGQACEMDENVANWDLDKVNKYLANYVVTNGEPVLTQSDVTSARDVCNNIAQRCKTLIESRANDSVEGAMYREIERVVLLRAIDTLWMDHIDALDDLRQSVGLQAIGQHDPLMVYKKESYDMFEQLNEQIKVKAIRDLMFGKFQVQFTPKVTVGDNVNTEKTLNGPCPCGSGKKYKNCCYLKDHPNESSSQTEQRPLSKKEEYALKREQRKQDKQNNK